MALSQPRSDLGNHVVHNQPTPRRGRDLWAEDTPLREAATAFGGRVENMAQAGKVYGSEELIEAGINARRDPPRLKLFARSGHRLDEVEFNQGYHDCMRAGIEQGFTWAGWDGQPGGHVTHAAHMYMLGQIEPGVCCPLAMTYAVIPSIRRSPELAKIWEPKLMSSVYDPSTRPVGEKQGVTMGMAMTEKQGGSDVRANSTKAYRDGDAWRLSGHKWFCSAPMCDAFLTLAYTDAGLSCFLVPRWLEGERNSMRLQRLKEKLGNQANASSEIEYFDALAYLVGDEGDGVRTIIDMVHHTRLDSAIAPAGLMGAALSEAKWWVNGRSAFQRKLIDQPLMRSVLADLVLDWEASTASALYMASVFDQDGPEATALARIGVALTKFFSNKRCIPVVAEAMEVLGGMGYIEETPMPFYYREAPLNGIWEGSGNVICLDILRTMAREPLATEALNKLLDDARGLDRRYDQALEDHRSRWPGIPPEGEARWFVESLAVLMNSAILFKVAPNAVVDGYIQTRVLKDRGMVQGAVSGLDEAAILERL